MRTLSTDLHMENSEGYSYILHDYYMIRNDHNELNSRFSYPCRVVNSVLAVRKDADGPRWQVVVPIPEGDRCS